MQDIQELDKAYKFRIIVLDEKNQTIVECAFLKKYIDLKREHVVKKACERVYE